MNLEELKAALEDLNADSHYEPANLDIIRDNVMRSRDTFKWRDFREIAACIVVWVVFSAILYLEISSNAQYRFNSNLPFDLSWLTRLGAIICSCAALCIGTSIYTGRQRHRVFPELSVVEFLEAEIIHLDYQIRLLRGVSWWYLGPFAIGFLMFIWGLLPIPACLALSVGYFILDRTINWHNQREIRIQLQPQKDKLERVYQSLSDIVDADPVPHSTKD